MRSASEPTRPLAEFVQLSYAELREIAGHLLSRYGGHGPPNATSLVHEAYTRLARQSGLRFQDETHFLRTCARAMRFVLVDQVRRRTAVKRGGGGSDGPLPADCIEPDPDHDVLAIEEALERLSRVCPRKTQVVELRFFGGLSIEETAEVMGLSTATVKREWAFARAWLYRELRQETGE